MAANPSPAPELSVVMPCLNEAETLQGCIEKASRFLGDNAIEGEIVVADNGSSDGSRAIAERLAVRLVTAPQKGYGSALMEGVRAARGRYIVMGDADGSYDFSALMPFVTRLRQGYDLVMGNRFKGGIKPGAMPALHRYLGNPVLTAIGRVLFRSPCGDFHCGLRGFSRDAVLRMNLQTTGMEFASEMVLKATLLGMRIAEVPTVLWPDGRSRPPHLRSWRDGWRHLRFMLLYSPRWLFLYPGLALMAVGLTFGAWLLPGPRRLGAVTLDVHTLLYAAILVMLGFQAVNFAVFTKIFAMTQGLLPEDPRVARVFRWVTLEVGIAVGAVLFFLGIGASAFAVRAWSVESYGPLDPTRVLRITIPAVLALTLGLEVILSSFFLSVLGLRRRTHLD
jgi:glycosyltransferase involved in cell wall biosynthesis